MSYKKIVLGGNILGVCEVEKGGNIDEDEYNRLIEIIGSMPTAPDGYYYALRSSDEEWELIKMPDPMNDDIDDAEAYNIIFGGVE